MRTKPSVVLLLILTLVAATTVPAEDAIDAESGGDASDLIDTATTLPGEGKYTGTLLNTDDTDWYVLPLPAAATSRDEPVCARATAVGSGKSDLVLNADAGARELRNVADSDGAPITLAARLGTDVYTGLDPFTLLDVPTDYTFTIHTWTLGDLGPMDAGTDNDAGNMKSQATAFPGPCLAGIVRNVNDVDVYKFDAAEGDLLFISLEFIGTEPLVVDLVSPSGNVVKRLDAPDALSLDVTESGTWYLVATPQLDTTMTMSSSDGGLVDGAAYVLGLEVDEKPTRPPCKPSCLT